jgi:hypothetical protein
VLRLSAEPFRSARELAPLTALGTFVCVTSVVWSGFGIPAWGTAAFGGAGLVAVMCSATLSRSGTGPDRPAQWVAGAAVVVPLVAFGLQFAGLSIGAVGFGCIAAAELSAFVWMVHRAMSERRNRRRDPA